MYPFNNISTTIIILAWAIIENQLTRHMTLYLYIKPRCSEVHQIHVYIFMDILQQKSLHSD